MIQRIQSIYLLLVAALMGAVTFFSPLIFSTATETFSMSYMGVINTATGAVVFDTIPLSIHSVLTTSIAFISIFFFKKRMVQIRLSIFNMVLLIGYIPMLVYYMFQINKHLNTSSGYQVFAVFPIIAAILSFLAVRAIGKDEALIRSLDRIR